MTEDTTPLFYESLTNLAWLAGVTDSGQPWRRLLCIPCLEPVLAAKQVANIDLLSDGHLILGVGPGGATDGNNRDFEVLNIPRSEKWARTKEYLSVMQEIWTDPKPSYEGRWTTSSRPTSTRSRSRNHMIWECARMERSIEIMAEHCIGWIPSFITPEEYPRLANWLRVKAASGPPARRPRPSRGRPSARSRRDSRRAPSRRG
ncbi:MAG: LLM class flavin-dependent oxidoreductase [Candidatus Dormibacteraeota bacterium]|uniref:LLM class flavin-dependent oxidoreductase n=1 Tax=Candidatus Dormiibacter inghamiae TaxID=3127013 RepID=A0A934KGQ2_9BACT|nr:LLM class flavin-dependent oxidoreductase [Candidatus Dormibacteraeota bacterium]MBJ7605284.1 LLM class flavin-dependent oxidoreductase [Candidatus Dormibacteraeota bacterium]